jgi:hypothetical protein
VLKLVDNFRGVAEISIGNGNSFMFWADNWKVDGEIRPIKDRFPRLYSFVLDGNMSAAKVYGQEDLTDLFHLPLSVQAYAELSELQSMSHGNPVTPEGDSWNFCWDPTYTAAKFYNHIHAHNQVPSVYRWIWKSSCTMRIKCFTWFLLSDRLNTRDLLQCKHWKVTEDTHCELCPFRLYKDRVHLFFECNFSARVWNYLQVEWIQHPICRLLWLRLEGISVNLSSWR